MSVLDPENGKRAIAGFAFAVALFVAPASGTAQTPPSEAVAALPVEDVAPVAEDTVPAEAESFAVAPGAEGETANEEAAAAPASEADAENARAYCANVADAVADARYARQAQALMDLGKQIEERIKLLEDKRAEYENWLTRREDFLRKADESVVAIFTQMRPDAASQQMAAMAMEAAAAILVKLNPRIASAILNEMDPARAAMLTTTMAGLANPDDGEQTPG